MAERNHTLPGLARGKWVRVAFTLTLASGLALILLLIPVTAGTLIRVPVPPLTPPEPAAKVLPPQTERSTGPSIDVSLPFGAARVYATNGLTITKIAAPTVEQGGVLTYTLFVTNETGDPLTDAEVLDPVPTGTTCLDVLSPLPPPVWTNNDFSCGTAAVWRLFYFPPFAPAFLNNTTSVLTYSVGVSPLLPDGYEIVNENYSVDAESASSTFSDIGPPFTTTVRAPNWLITKTASSAFVQPGEYLTYTITITNSGSLPTSGAYTVTDPVPDDTFSGLVLIQPPGTLANNITVTWVLTEVLPALVGSKTLTYAVRVRTPLTDGVAIVNQDYGVTGGNVFSPTVGGPITVTVNSPATLNIFKSASSDPVQAGDLLTYTITVVNNPSSLGPALGVVISDTLPGDVISPAAGFVGSVTGTITATGNAFVWTLADPIGVGDSAQVTVTARVTSPLLPGDVLTNTFSAVGVNTPFVSDRITTTITSTNVISLNKRVNSADVAPGDVVTYTITLTNSGNSVATVNLTDVLHPAFVPATVVTPGLTIPGRTPFTTGTTETVIFSATAPLTPGLYFNQVITAAYDSTQTTISNIAPVRVVSAVITITKVANVAVAGIGETITYTYAVTNAGNTTLTNIVLIDDPLDSITLTTTTLGPTDSTTGTATTVITEATLPSSLVNTATVTGTFLNNNPVTTSITESVEISYTNAISIAKSPTTSSGEPARIGDTVTYTYYITNIGTVNLNNIVLIDDRLGVIPVITPSLAPGGNTEALSSTVVVTANLPGPLVNTAAVTGINIIGQVTPVATATASVLLTYTPTITVVKSFVASAGEPARIGDTITYTYLITNTGPVTLSNIVLTDDKLGSLPVISPTLGPGQDTEVFSSTTVVETDLPGPLTNTVTVTGTDILSQTTVASATATVELTYTIGITVNKIASMSAADVGETITYTYRVTNTGGVTLTGVTLFDDKLAGFIPISDTLGPGQGTEVFSITTVTEDDVLAGPTLVNTATVTGTNNVVSRTVVATDTATVALTFTTSISLEKTANLAEATIGDVILYTYRITNTGDVALFNITVVDDNLGQIAQPFTLPSGAPILLPGSYPVTIIDFPGPLTNTAVVTGETKSGTPVVTDTAVATVTLVYTPGISLDKTANVTAALQGETITYTYQVANTGNITLTNLLLFDDKLGLITNLAPTSLGPDSCCATGTATYTVPISDLLKAITNTATVSGNDIIEFKPISDTDTLVVNVLDTLTVITATNSSPNSVNSPTFFNVTTNLSSGVTYTWNFGDGTPTTMGQSPTHTYTTVATYTAVVTASNGVSMLTDTTVVTITPGPLYRFLLTATSPQTAGIGFPITITAVDAFSNTITTFNQAVTIGDDTGTIIPTSVTLIDGITMTNFAVFSATSPDLDRITAISGTISGFVDVEILPSDPTTLTLTLSPTTPIRVCGTTTATVRLVDNFGNPVPDQPITVGKLGGVGNIAPPSAGGNTDVAGVFAPTFQSVTSGITFIFARHDVFSDTLNDLDLLNILEPPLADAITVTVSPATVVVNDPALVTAEVTDCQGDPVSGTVVTFTIASLGGIAPVTATTDISGEATSTVTAGAIPGTTTIDASVDVSLTDTTPFTIVPLTFPVLTIAKSASPPSGSVVGPGAKINYQIVVANSGTAAATGLVITDVLTSAVTYDTGSITSGSGPIENSGVVNFSVPSLGAGDAVTATIEVTVATTISGTQIVNEATASSNETGSLGNSNMVSHRVITFAGGDIYLPIIMKKPGPDLTISSLTTDPLPGGQIRVTVVVANGGSVSTGEGFWVDFYVNPAGKLPNDASLGRDRRWNNPEVNSLKGIAWKITSPLGPGGSLTLTSDGSVGLGPDPGQTDWDGTLPSGNNRLYSFADSFDLDDPTGPTNVEIVETNEDNNMAGPLNLIVTGLETESEKPATSPQIPPRSDLGN